MSPRIWFQIASPGVPPSLFPPSISRSCSPVTINESSNPKESQDFGHCLTSRALADCFFQGTECWFYEETWDDPDADNIYPERGQNCLW